MWVRVAEARGQTWMLSCYGGTHMDVKLGCSEKSGRQPPRYLEISGSDCAIHFVTGVLI